MFDNPDNLQEDPTDDKDFQPMEIEGLFKIDLLGVAYSLEKVLQPYCPAPPEGFYIDHHLEPVMVPSNTYYQRSYGADGQRVERFARFYEDITDTVYDKRGQVILPSRIAKNKEKLLFHFPTMPFWGVKAARAMLEDLVVRRQPHTRHRSTGRQAIIRMFPLLDPPPMYTDEDPEGRTYEARSVPIFNALDMMEDIFVPIEQEVNRFITGKEWHYYFFRHAHALTTIEKGPDYRIRQWEAEHGHEFR